MSQNENNHNSSNKIPAETSSTQIKRFYSLDILRGLAAFLVICRHAPSPDNPPDNISEKIYSVFREIGWTGVDLFFVLSGFLISGLLVKEIEKYGSLNLKRFIIRRGFKIWPTYYFAYGTVFLLGCFRDTLASRWDSLTKNIYDAIPNIFFLQNYIHCTRWNHSWSIAVEEHFYLCLPLVLIIALYLFQSSQNKIRKLSITMILFTITICSLALALRFYNFHSGYKWETNYYQSHLRCDSLLFGVMLTFISRVNKNLTKSIHLWLPAGIILILTAWTITVNRPLNSGQYHDVTYVFTLLYLGFGALVLAAGCYPEFGLKGPWLFRKFMSFLAYIGVYSYTIYIAHSTVFNLPGAEFTRSIIMKFIAKTFGFLHLPADLLPWADRSLFLVSSIIGGIALTYIIEGPFLNLREKWYPSSSRGIAKINETPAT